MFSLREIAIQEESRQATGTAEIGLESERIAGGWMTFAGVGSWANQACGLGLEGPVTSADLNRLVEFYVSRGVEPKVEVCPFADETLIAGLASRGFRLQEFENVFARKLKADDDLKSLHPHGWPQGLDLVRVDTANQLEVDTFVEVSTQGFRDKEISDVQREVTTKMVRHPRCDSFLARIDNEYVAGGAMESSNDAACLFGTSVAAAYQRRGIQTALILCRLVRARERGCSVALIHSRPGISTERNALRLGFFLAYTKVALVMPGSGLTPSP